LTQEAERRIGELGDGCVAFVVGDVSVHASQAILIVFQLVRRSPGLVAKRFQKFLGAKWAQKGTKFPTVRSRFVHGQHHL
jgi:hypothetical protein